MINQKLVSTNTVLQGVKAFMCCYQENEKELSPLITNVACRALSMVEQFVNELPAAEAKPVVHAQWQKQWCDSSMIGHMYEECPICGCMILDTEKFWDCKFCPNCGTEMLGD
jgi:hypothetical protein